MPSVGARRLNGRVQPNQPAEPDFSGLLNCQKIRILEPRGPLLSPVFHLSMFASQFRFADLAKWSLRTVGQITYHRRPFAGEKYRHDVDA
jgi:hypothetical protein